MLEWDAYKSKTTICGVVRVLKATTDRRQDPSRPLVTCTVTLSITKENGSGWKGLLVWAKSVWKGKFEEVFDGGKKLSADCDVFRFRCIKSLFWVSSIMLNSENVK